MKKVFLITLILFPLLTFAAEKSEPRVGHIEEKDVERISRRQKALHLSTFGIGPYWSSNVGQEHPLYGFSLGRAWEVSTIGEIKWDVMAAFNSHGFYSTTGIGFDYLPMTGEFSP